MVQLDFGEGDMAERLEEVHLLVESAGANVCADVVGKRRSPDPATFAGKGKVEEVAAEVIDGPQSEVWEEAENRMHAQKALMEYLVLGRVDV